MTRVWIRWNLSLAHNWVHDAEVGCILADSVRMLGKDEESKTNIAEVMLETILRDKVLVVAGISRADLEAKVARRSILDDMTLIVIALPPFSYGLDEHA